MLDIAILLGRTVCPVADTAEILALFVKSIVANPTLAVEPAIVCGAVVCDEKEYIIPI